VEIGYRIAAVSVLAVHLIWILWVIFGALWTRGHPWWTGFHLGSLVWGIIVETGPWPCPLTMAEQFFEVRAGGTPYEGSFMQHLLEQIVYPDLPYELLTIAAVIVCGFNLLIYARRGVLAYRRARAI
jgi:hypothetical protein